VKEVELHPPDGLSRELWSRLGDLVDVLPTDWVLVGGMMVQLHALESGIADVRVTRDVDVLGQARPRGALDAIHDALLRNGFDPDVPDLDGYAQRYTKHGLVVDVLAPDGVKPPPTVGEGRRAVEIPGGSQALGRREEVAVHLVGRRFVLCRPELLGAILVKARSLMVHSDPEAQREDLLLLLSLVEDPRSMARELRKSERAWLRRAETRLALDRPATIAAEAAQRARLAFRLLTRG
jgi:hypothetical protein